MAEGALLAFGIVVLVVGGLELFDRTSFALIALATRSTPGPTWAGGAAAFVLTTVLAVAVGATLLNLLGPNGTLWVRFVGGLFLVAYALWLLYRGPEADRLPETTARGAFTTAFLTVFLLELGDTTMIFEAVFVGNFGWWIVLVGGALALVTVAAWDVWLGRRLARRVRPQSLHYGVTAVLALVGAFTLAYGLEPGWFPWFR